ncbi:MAG: hypothetical protein AB1925_25485 [Actinomycetota bacterium]
MAEQVRGDGEGTVLVAGATRAGVTSVADRLREQLPEHRFIEAHELRSGQAPVAVVWVVSATAPMPPSQRARFDAVTACTGAVVAVVNKIDDHRGWRQVLAANRARVPAATWVAASAAPRVGKPCVDDVVTALARQLADPTLVRRNAARAAQAERAGHAQSRYRLHQLRLELIAGVRRRCAAARAELLTEVATMRGRAEVEDRVRRRCHEIHDEVCAELEARVTELTALPVPPAPRPACAPAFLPSRRLETQLMVVLGAGFGFGVALVVARLAASLTSSPGWALGAGGVAGVAVTVWVVRVRGLLHDRAVWERWVGDVVAALRTDIEEVVSSRLLAVEAAGSTVLRGPVDGFRGYRSVAGRPGPTVSSSESFL